ncbi:class I SAM-dependent methyltransferase [Georgenia sp. SYP-B2076]|uniref:class I SAM-dependent methyltransferase n=1 Tax=Georgenia sp. SYP-B2076 TaxID=2495881 RepID=UPI000F8DF77A|nr:class I SAM-dependent methyltransferase [Georgenia sp. SYP-B2076]
MTARQLAWRACYELLAARVRRPEWAFMNYGFASREAPPLALDDADEPDRLCIQLYDHTLSGTDLRGRDVLEAGCGRGGGSSYVSRYLGPRSMTGLDLSSRAVALCTRTRRAPGLVFVQGDAQAMPFPDAAFDAVLNVESSHCYGSMESFLAEVHRVLRPGGDFLFADLRDRGDVGTLRRQLAASALTVRRDRDITSEVLAALRADNARKLALIDAWIPRAFHRLVRPFAGIEGTRNYVRLESGDMRYLSAHLVKEPLPPG